MMPVRPPALPRLAAFCRAYLHQDFLQVYPSAAAALVACANDSNAREAQRLAADVRAFAAFASARSLADIRAWLAEACGAAWAPRRRAEIEAFVRALDPPGARAARSRR